MTRLGTTTSTALISTVLIAALSGCGGDDASGSPDDASQGDFCTAFLDQPEDFGSDDPDKAVDAAHEYADRLREVGTPDVSDDAREGFELYVDFLADLEADDADELKDKKPSDIFSDDELDKFEAFSDVTADCGPGEFETDAPGD